jgi:hypothetical protein
VSVNRRQPVYRVVGGDTLIELKSRDVRELFNALDPAPLQRRDLNVAAEEYVVGALREIGLQRPVRMRVYLPEQGLAAARAADLAASMRNYFAYRRRHVAGELRQLLRRGLASLMIALLFMSACLSVRQSIYIGSPQAALTAVREGLLVVAWVAMWRPLEIFLYDWWPIWQQGRLYERLSRIEIELAPLPETPAMAATLDAALRDRR